MRHALLAAASLLALLAGSAEAAPNTTGLVVTTCGSTQMQPGNPGPFTVDQYGNTCTTATAPTPTPTGGLALGASTAAEASHVIKSGAGNLYSLQANSSASGYVMLFDATSLPADGAVTPLLALPVSTFLSMSWGGLPPAHFSTGIVAACSSTGPFTLTSASVCNFTWQVQ